MKKVLLLIILGLTGIACERGDPENEPGTLFENQLTDGLCISFGDSILINHEDIDYYDYSTHIIYLKENHPLFQNPVDWELGGMSFEVYSLEENIYSGVLFPAWWSSMPSGAYIQWPSFYPGYVIKIEFMSPPVYMKTDTTADPREDERIVEALQQYGQYHQGIALELGDIQFSSSGRLSFSYTLTNEDSFDYYVLSPDKMGTGLFHYFTNGLYLYNEETGWLQHQIGVESPEPWDLWETGWLDRLNHQTSKTYRIEYDEFDQVPPGTYFFYFRFPGLTHVDQEDREGDGALIWMGELEFSGEIKIESNLP